jgi:glycosyltransferase involved in cell wall biosynthesis
MDIQVEVEVDARLDYSDQVWSEQDDFWYDASVLATWLLQQGGGTSLFWTHNPTLGKNALLTAGLMLAAQKAEAAGFPHRFFYHIHDFAECGRLWNLVNLRRCWGGGGMEDFYPVANNVGYAILNSADSLRLAQAGIPKDRIFHLPNAVTSIRAEKKKSKESIALELQRYAHNRGYRFEPERQWWTLPIRLIRRKNVVEALLLAATTEDPVQLLVTLDANSEPERPYAEAVKDLFRKHNHAAVVGFGHELVGSAFSFDDLLLSSDVVVTTSLLEGFGFTFLEGANRGIPLLGRNLNELTSDFAAAGFPEDSLYEQFLVPVDRGTREEMISKGRQFAKKQGQLLGLNSSTIDRFGDEVKAIFSDDAVDFGFLELNQQLGLIDALREKAFVQELRSLNPAAAEPTIFPHDFNERVEGQFGLQIHATKVAAAIEGLFAQTFEEANTEKISSRLLDLYFLPRFHRPLIGGW